MRNFESRFDLSILKDNRAICNLKLSSFFCCKFSSRTSRRFIKMKKATGNLNELFPFRRVEFLLNGYLLINNVFNNINDDRRCKVFFLRARKRTRMIRRGSFRFYICRGFFWAFSAAGQFPFPVSSALPLPTFVI